MKKRYIIMILVVVMIIFIPVLTLAGTLVNRYEAENLSKGINTYTGSDATASANIVLYLRYSNNEGYAFVPSYNSVGLQANEVYYVYRWKATEPGTTIRVYNAVDGTNYLLETATESDVWIESMFPATDGVTNMAVATTQDSVGYVVLDYIDIMQYTPMVVTGVNPSDSTEIPINQEFQITFDQNIDITSTDLCYLTDGVENVPITFSVDGNVLTIKPISDLDYSTLYTLHIEGVKNVIGLPMEGYSEYTYTTVQEIVPFKLISSYPADGSKYVGPDSSITFTYNYELDNTTTVTEFVYSTDGTNVPFSSIIDAKSIIITPDNTLQADAEYEVTISAVAIDGQISIDNITFHTLADLTGNYEIDTFIAMMLGGFDDIRFAGIGIISTAIAVGLVFISARWLWNRTRQWLKKVG